MTTTRNETFEVFDDHLVRQVVPVRGQPYEPCPERSRRNRCPRAAFEQISHAAEELGDQGLPLDAVVEYERQAGRDVTFTQVAVALAFLRERSILDVRYRRNYAATDAVHLDAMTEYHALAEHG